MLDRESRAVQESPNHEGPTGTVPESGQKHGQQQVAVGGESRTPATAQGDVEVVSQPAGERHMPAPPEIPQ